MIDSLRQNEGFNGRKTSYVYLNKNQLIRFAYLCNQGSPEWCLTFLSFVRTLKLCVPCGANRDIRHKMTRWNEWKRSTTQKSEWKKITQSDIAKKRNQTLSRSVIKHTTVDWQTPIFNFVFTSFRWRAVWLWTDLALRKINNWSIIRSFPENWPTQINSIIIH